MKQILAKNIGKIVHISYTCRFGYKNEMTAKIIETIDYLVGLMFDESDYYYIQYSKIIEIEFVD